MLIQEQEQDYKDCQKDVNKHSLQRITNASSNIQSYCKILDNISNPSDVMLDSYKKNLKTNVRRVKANQSLV